MFWCASTGGAISRVMSPLSRFVPFDRDHGSPRSPLVPAKAGTQGRHGAAPWMPAFAGMSGGFGAALATSGPPDERPHA
ncbi:hypothetical protein CH338_13595 [Rhodoplanes elegans]|uniref:Uncharacterized protein n=1 Tax=Rhodoplanes elegans TaxID=29408 RepID=A0A327KJ70_9BRAD|nr:hypothetical protein CH338_13595 [Rhodoplanes elegans]